MSSTLPRVRSPLNIVVAVRTTSFLEFFSITETPLLPLYFPTPHLFNCYISWTGLTLIYPRFFVAWGYCTAQRRLIPACLIKRSFAARTKPSSADFFLSLYHFSYCSSIFQNPREDSLSFKQVSNILSSGQASLRLSNLTFGLLSRRQPANIHSLISQRQAFKYKVLVHSSIYPKHKSPRQRYISPNSRHQNGRRAPNIHDHICQPSPCQRPSHTVYFLLWISWSKGRRIPHSSRAEYDGINEHGAKPRTIGVSLLRWSITESDFLYIVDRP